LQFDSTKVEVFLRKISIFRQCKESDIAVSADMMKVMPES
jgi:hypothetical protein